jgi:hypothetical protein
VTAVLPVLLLALELAVPAPTPDRRACVPGTSIGCEDRDPCTVDRCENLTCVHTPATGPACNDRDACTEQDHCEAGTCVGVPVTCADDGFSCTDDVCLGDGCVHVPVDSRCASEDACTTSVCAPEREAHEASGCAPGRPRNDGQECAEDGDACTVDACVGGRCAHQRLPDQVTCNAVQGVFRHALSLESAARALEALLSPGTPDSTVARLAGVRAALEGTAAILSGKTHADAANPPGGPPETLVRKRARLALGVLVRARPQIVALAHIMGRSPAGEHPAAASDVARQSRLLLRGTRALRAQLRRLLAVRSTFVR